MDLTQLSYTTQLNNNIHYDTRLVQMKFDMGTLCLDNNQRSFWQLIDRWIQRVLDQLSPTVD